MTSSIRRLSMLAFGACALAACSPGGQKDAEAPPPSTPAAAAAAPTPLPAVDTANAAQFVLGEAKLEALDFPRTGTLSVKGTVKGEAGPVYAVPAAKDQTVTITFAPANANLYFNVSDATDHSGAALFRGEVSGTTAKLTATTDMTYVITPFQPRAMARRGETGDFSLTVARD